MDPEKLAQFLGEFGSGFFSYIAALFSLRDERSVISSLSPDDGKILVFAFLAAVTAVEIHFLFIAGALPAADQLTSHVVYKSMVWVVATVVSFLALDWRGQKLGAHEVASAILRVLPAASVISAIFEVMVFWTVFAVLHRGQAQWVAVWAAVAAQTVLVLAYLPSSLLRSGVSARVVANLVTLVIAMLGLGIDAVFLMRHSA